MDIQALERTFRYGGPSTGWLILLVAIKPAY